MLSGFARRFETIPKIKPPNPKPQIIIPETIPIRSCRCDQPAFNAGEYMKPFPIPNPVP